MKLSEEEAPLLGFCNNIGQKPQLLPGGKGGAVNGGNIMILNDNCSFCKLCQLFWNTVLTSMVACECTL